MVKEKGVRRFITKEWQTKGICMVTGDITEFGAIRFQLKGRYPDFAYKQDHFATFQEAQERVQKLRMSKIESLKKQIAKLQTQSFEGFVTLE